MRPSNNFLFPSRERLEIEMAVSVYEHVQ
jgi:hypothetical protein